MAESNNNFVVKPFAGNATNNGQFGSFDAGAPQTTNDVIFMQSLDAWLSGWLNATSGATKLPRLEEFQGIQRVFSQALININQYGIKPYLEEEAYRLNAFVQDENGKLYQSLEDNNIGSPLTDTTKWNNNPFNTGDFALLNGDENETFKVANATANNEAVRFSQSFGLGQTWKDKTATNRLGTTYINTSTNTIAVTVSGYLSGAIDLQGFVEDINVANQNINGQNGMVILIVPPLQSYRVTTSSGDTTLTLQKWQELTI